MCSNNKPRYVVASEVPPRKRSSSYPEPFATRTGHRERRSLGDYLGLSNVGVNLTRIKPGSSSALLHTHSKMEEFVYMLEGEVSLVTSTNEVTLVAGMCVGFPQQSEAHHLVNRTDQDAVLLELSDRPLGDMPIYPEDDLKLTLNAKGNLHWVHKDGTPY